MCIRDIDGFTLEQHQKLSKLNEELAEIMRDAGDFESASEFRQSQMWHKKRTEMFNERVKV